MGGPKTSTTTNQSQSQTSPWATAQPYFGNLYNQGAGAVSSNQSLPIPQQFVAGENPTEASAVSQTLGAAPNLGASGANLSNMANMVAGGYFLNPMNDPTFSGAANSAITPVLRQLTQSVLPNLTGDSISNGGRGGSGPSAYGGADLGLNQEKALQDFGTNALNTTASMANASRNAGLNLIPQAGGIASAADQQLLAPATATGAAGTAQQGYAQQSINDLLQKYSAMLAQPWQGLQPFANLLTSGGFNQAQGSSQGTATTPAPDLMTQILQGLTGTAGIFGSMFGAPAGGTSAFSGLSGLLSGMFGGGSSSMPAPMAPAGEGF